MQREGKQERKCCCQAPAFTQPWFYLQSWCNNLNFSSPSVFARCWQVPGHTGGSSSWAPPTEQRCPGSCVATGAPPGSSLLFSLAWEGATARTFTHLMFLCILKKKKGLTVRAVAREQLYETEAGPSTRTPWRPLHFCCQRPLGSGQDQQGWKYHSKLSHRLPPGTQLTPCCPIVWGRSPLCCSPQHRRPRSVPQHGRGLLLFSSRFKCTHVHKNVSCVSLQNQTQLTISYFL